MWSCKKGNKTNKISFTRFWKNKDFEHLKEWCCFQLHVQGNINNVNLHQFCIWYWDFHQIRHQLWRNHESRIAGLIKCIFLENKVSFPTISYVFMSKIKISVQIVKFPTNLITNLPFSFSPPYGCMINWCMYPLIQCTVFFAFMHWFLF